MARSVEELADREISRWLEVRRTSASQSPRPCVAISRLPGSGALEFCRNVADQLDYAFFSLEVIDWIARRVECQQRIAEGVDQRILAAIERTTDDVFQQTHFADNDYIRRIVHTVIAIGEQGSAVILGRGSPFILSPERALRVYMVARTGMRVELMAKRRAITLDDAASVIAGEDADRQSFLRHQFRLDPDDPARFDLAVNLGSLSIDAAAHLVVEALRIRFPGTGAKPLPETQ